MINPTSQDECLERNLWPATKLCQKYEVAFHFPQINLLESWISACLAPEPKDGLVAIEAPRMTG